MENPKIISKEYYRSHELCFTEDASSCSRDDMSAPVKDASSDSMCVGEVFHANERIAYCESVDIDSARQYCRQIVDTLIAQSSAVQATLQPETTELANALITIRDQLDARLQCILQAHWQNDNQALSINVLKQAGSYESTTAVYLAYAELSRLLCDALSHIPLTPRNGQDPYLNLIIETVEPDLHSSESLSLRLKPSIYRALEPFFSV